MSTGWIISVVGGSLLLPPLNLALAALAGLLLMKRHPRGGAALCAASLIVLLVISSNAGSRLLVATLENRVAALDAPRAARAQAIVVLGGGRIENAPEYGGHDIPGLHALPRLRYAARLQRETGLPLLVSGGAPDGAEEPEAAIMARTLREDFQVPVRWLEQESDNTAQNAQFSAQLLKSAGVRRILLVTTAMHMPRSQAMFERAGLEVVPAPTVFFGRKRFTPVDLVPKSEGLLLSRYALHEWIGMASYAIRYGSSSSAMPD